MAYTFCWALSSSRTHVLAGTDWTDLHWQKAPHCRPNYGQSTARLGRDSAGAPQVVA